MIWPSNRLGPAAENGRTLGALQDVRHVLRAEFGHLGAALHRVWVWVWVCAERI